MKRVTIKHLRYFVALARHGHFSRAADACAISQPALSVQVKELEDILGAALVERGPRQIRLTGIGQTLAARARDILRAVDELDDLARSRATGCRAAADRGDPDRRALSAAAADQGARAALSAARPRIHARR